MAPATNTFFGSGGPFVIALNPHIPLSAEEVQVLDDLIAPAPPYPAWMQGMSRDAKVAEALGEG